MTSSEGLSCRISREPDAVDADTGIVSGLRAIYRLTHNRRIPRESGVQGRVWRKRIEAEVLDQDVRLGFGEGARDASAFHQRAVVSMVAPLLHA